MLAGCRAPIDSVTDSVCAPVTTCAFVTMSPFPSNTTPEPSPVLVWICTTSGETVLTTLLNSCCSTCPAGAVVAAVADDAGAATAAG
jgi:hypothetical protein